jgi:23S rRNA pseudouridine1911/1915/1917 synthase
MSEDIDIQDDDQELFEHFKLVIDKGQAPLRIDKFLMNRIENATRSKVQQSIEAGNVLVNGKQIKSNYKVKPGDSLTVVFTHPPREIELIPENIPLNIVYEDDNIVIVNKNPGMVVHPAYGNYTGTLVNALIYHFQQLPKSKGAEFRPGLVHRIDKNTSGIMAIAKDELSMARLAKKFYDRDIDRIYIALVWGDPKADEGTITGNIGRSIKDRKVMDVFPADSEMGKHAVTHYKVLKRFGYVTLIQCKLETGRTHQIRVHMRYAGHPLFNDEVYGGNKILKGTTFPKYKQFVENCFKILPRQALHAKSLGFKHPITSEYMNFDSELPEDMKAAIEKWEKYAEAYLP